MSIKLKLLRNKKEDCPIYPITATEGVIHNGTFLNEYLNYLNGCIIDINAELANIPTRKGEGENSAIQNSTCSATSDYSYAEGARTKSQGIASHTEGTQTTASNNNSHAEGQQTQAVTANTHSEGNMTIASGTGAHAEGLSTTASGKYAHAEGNKSTASGGNAHAEGSETTASALGSHAEGNKTTASGNNSHAEGDQTLAKGATAHAEGGGTSANQARSHAEGNSTTTSGYASHAEGNGSVAAGYASHAEGNGTITTNGNNGEHAEGQFNASHHDSKTFGYKLNTISSVGIGGGNEDRKNAHEIMQNGDHFIYGLGDYDGTNPDESSTLQQVIDGKQAQLTDTDNSYGQRVKTLEDSKLPIMSETYTGLYYGANSTSNGYFCPICVKPKDTTKVIGDYHIKIRVTTSCNNYPNYKNWTVADFWFDRTGSVNCYKLWNWRVGSYLHYYLDSVYTASNTSFNTVGTHIGVGIVSGNNYSSASYKRNTLFEILEVSNDLVVTMDEPEDLKQYTLMSWFVNGMSHSTYNAFDVGLQETGDANTTAYNGIGSVPLNVSPNIRLAHGCLMGFDGNNKAQAISAYTDAYTSYTTSINKDRVYAQDGYNWQKGMFYPAFWSNYAKDAFGNPTFYTYYSDMDFRLTDNCVCASSANELGIVKSKSLYFRGVIKEDGLFYIRPLEVTYNNVVYKRAWTQDIPTEVEYDGDGYQYTYWYIGEPYYNSSYPNAGYQVNYLEHHKMFWYHNGRFQEYTSNQDNSKEIVVTYEDGTTETLNVLIK